MSEREAIARIIDPEVFEPWEGWPMGQRDALAKADAILALSAAPSPVDGGGSGSSNASRAAMGPLPHVATEAEPSGLGGLGYDVGSVLWHSSEEDGGPDVGIQVGLGGGFSLYFGEIATSNLREHDIDLATYPDGWWAVLYGPKEEWIIGAIPDHYRAQEAIEHIAGLLASPLPLPLPEPGEGDSAVADSAARRDHSLPATNSLQVGKED